MRTTAGSLDLQFLNLDSPNTQQVIACFGFLESAPNFAQVQHAFARAVEQFPRLQQRPSESQWTTQGARRVFWDLDTKFALSDHVTEVNVPLTDGACSPQKQLLATIANAFSQPIGFEHPPWRFQIFHLGKESAFIFRLHHALADGLGGLEVLGAVTTASHKPDMTFRNGDPFDKRSSRVNSLGNSQKRATRLVVGSNPFGTASQLFRELLSSRPSSLVNGENSAVRDFLLASYPLEPLKRLKRNLGTSLNDLFLGTVSETLQRYRELRKQDSGSELTVRAIVPVNTRSASSRFELGNHLTGVTLPLIIGDDPLRNRLTRISEKSQLLKNKGRVGAFALISDLFRALPRRLQRPIVNALVRKTNLICTNVPFFSGARALGDAIITELYGAPALLSEHGIGFSFLSYEKQIYISAVFDPTIIDKHMLEISLNEAARRMQSLDKEEPASQPQITAP